MRFTRLDHEKYTGYEELSYRNGVAVGFEKEKEQVGNILEPKMSKEVETGPLPEKQDLPVTIASVDIDPEAERALVWKFDLRLLPVLAIMYLFNSLDKSNLGNAKTAGLVGECDLLSFP